MRLPVFNPRIRVLANQFIARYPDMSDDDKKEIYRLFTSLPVSSLWDSKALDKEDSKILAITRKYVRQS